MKRYLKLFLSVVVLFLAVPAWTWCAWLVTQPSTISVMLGFIAFAALLVVVLFAIIKLLELIEGAISS